MINMAYPKNQWISRSQLHPFWSIRQKNGSFWNIHLDQLRQVAKVVTTILDRPHRQPLTLGLTLTDDFSEEEASALAVFGINRVLVEIRRPLARGHQIVKEAAESWLVSRLWASPSDPEYAEGLQLFTTHITDDLKLTGSRIRSWPLLSDGNQATAALNALASPRQSSETYITKISAPSQRQFKTALPMKLGKTGSEDHDDSKSCLAQEQNSTRIQSPTMPGNTEEKKDFEKTGDSNNLSSSLRTSAQKTPTLVACADKPATFGQYEKNLKKSDLPSRSKTSQSIKAKLDFDVIATQRQTGMSTFHCWEHYVAINARVPTYGKAMFYKLVKEQATYQAPHTRSDARVHSPPIL